MADIDRLSDLYGVADKVLGIFPGNGAGDRTYRNYSSKHH